MVRCTVTCSYLELLAVLEDSPSDLLSLPALDRLTALISNFADDSLQSPVIVQPLSANTGIMLGPGMYDLPHFSCSLYSIATTLAGQRLCVSWYLTPSSCQLRRRRCETAETYTML